MRRLYAPFAGGPGAIGLLILRLIAGLALMQHGWPKIQKPFEWMPPAAGMPGILQALAALSEFGGGLAWALGLLTPIASLGVLFTMATATVKVHMLGGDPWVPPPGHQGGSYELASLYFAIAFVLMLAGPGRLSLDRLLFGGRPAPDTTGPSAAEPQRD
jgi:putative oxidoreductase